MQSNYINSYFIIEIIFKLVLQIEGVAEETERDSFDEGRMTCKNIKCIALCIFIIIACSLVAVIIAIAIKYKGKGN